MFILLETNISVMAYILAVQKMSETQLTGPTWTSLFLQYTHAQINLVAGTFYIVLSVFLSPCLSIFETYLLLF